MYSLFPLHPSLQTWCPAKENWSFIGPLCSYSRELTTHSDACTSLCKLVTTQTKQETLGRQNKGQCTQGLCRWARTPQVLSIGTHNTWLGCDSHEHNRILKHCCEPRLSPWILLWFFTTNRLSFPTWQGQSILSVLDSSPDLCPCCAQHFTAVWMVRDLTNSCQLPHKHG